MATTVVTIGSDSRNALYLRSRLVADTAPTNGQVLLYNSATLTWEPAAPTFLPDLAVALDPATSVRNVIQPTADVVAMTIAARVAGQTAVLTQWKNTAGSVVASVSPLGVIAGIGSGLSALDATALLGIVPLANLSGILNAQIAAGAAIAWSKISKSGALVSDLSNDAGYLTSAAADALFLTPTEGNAVYVLRSGSLADLTTRSAADLSSGTLPDARFPATLPVGSGVNLTALNASNLASGTLPDALFPATLPALSGTNLTALNASALASGTVPLARLSGITTTQLLSANVSQWTNNAGYLTAASLPRFSVTDYGAVADDATDNTAFILAAIAAAGANPGGGEVYFPPAALPYYCNTASIAITKDNIHLRGAGHNASVLRFADTAGSAVLAQPTLTASDTKLLAANGAIGDASITLEAGGGAFYVVGQFLALYTSDASVGRFTTRIEGIAGDVLTLEEHLPIVLLTSLAASVTSYSNFLEGFRMSDLGIIVGTELSTPVNRTILLQVYRTHHAIIERCRFRNAIAQMVLVSASKDAVVAHNLIERATSTAGEGISVTASTGTLVHHNHARNSAFSIDVVQSPKTIVSANSFSGGLPAGGGVSAGRGLKIAFGSNFSSAIGNHIYDTEKIAIYTYDSAYVDILANKILWTASGEAGISISANVAGYAHHVKVKDNIVVGCGGLGISVVDAAGGAGTLTYHDISGNTVDLAQGGINIATSGNKVTDNMVTNWGAGLNGIQGSAGTTKNFFALNYCYNAGSGTALKTSLSDGANLIGKNYTIGETATYHATDTGIYPGQELGDGTTALPSLAMASNPSVGWMKSASGYWVWVTAGVKRVMIDNLGLCLADGRDLSWRSSATADSGARDVSLFRGGAGILDLRVGTASQKFRWFHSWTATDYFGGSLSATAAKVTLGIETLGAGSDNGDVELLPAGSGGVLVGTFYQQFAEMTAPAAPAANSVRFYAEDNGAGKTRLMALFASGAAQQIAIEP